MKTGIKQLIRATVLLTGLGAVLGGMPAYAQHADEDVPEIAQAGPEGTPVHPTVWDGEDMKHIAQAGPKGTPAPVTVRDLEGDPDVDRLGPTGPENARHDVAARETAGGA